MKHEAMLHGAGAKLPYCWRRRRRWRGAVPAAHSSNRAGPTYRQYVPSIDDNVLAEFKCPYKTSKSFSPLIRITSSRNLFTPHYSKIWETLWKKSAICCNTPVASCWPPYNYITTSVALQIVPLMECAYDNVFLRNFATFVV